MDGKVNRQNVRMEDILCLFLVSLLFGTTFLYEIMHTIFQVNADVPEYMLNKELSMPIFTIFISAMFKVNIWHFGWKKKRFRIQIRICFGGMDWVLGNFFCTYMLMISIRVLIHHSYFHSII